MPDNEAFAQPLVESHADPLSCFEHYDGLGPHEPETAPSRWRVAFAHASFVVLFGLLSPLYYLNRWDFKRKTRRNPFYTSALVRIMDRYPLLYEIATLALNFPEGHRIYQVLPKLSGEVLQVGCGAGLLNRHLRKQTDLHFTNIDCNLNALRLGARLRRFSTYLHCAIDKPTPLPDHSFDAIVFARSFHHVRNHRRALAECARLLREGGTVIIADPVMLQEARSSLGPAGYMANSSIDGVIWRFTRESFERHVRACLPPGLTIRSVNLVRQPHVTNYNLFVPQTDLVAVLVMGSVQRAGTNHPTHRAS